MMKKTALAASITVALAGVSLPASSAILGTAAEGLLVPVFVHDNDMVEDTVVQISTPANIGFDGVPNNFTAPNTTPSSAGPSLDSVYASYIDGAGNKKSTTLNWYWFDWSSYKVYDGSVPVTANDVTELRASVIVPGAAGVDGYLVVATAAAKANPDAGANVSMFGRGFVEIDDDDDAVVDDTVEIPVLGLTDGPDNGLTMPTKQDNIKYAGIANAPIVSPLVTGIRTNVSNGKLDALTVFDLEVAAAGFEAAHIVWLDQNRGSCSSLGGGSIGGYIYDTEEKRQSWGGCIPWELSWYDFWTDDLQADFPGVNLDLGGYIQYILPEYQDDPALGDGPQSAGYAFALVQKAAGDWILSLANEQAMYNAGCVTPGGVAGPCVPKP